MTLLDAVLFLPLAGFFVLLAIPRKNEETIRRAALGFLQWIDGETDAAKATVAPCLPGGADAGARERGACLWAAGIIDPGHAEEIAKQLDALAAEATETQPAYGDPASLASLVRARANGGCVRVAGPLDFYATYHVPLFATWTRCALTEKR